MKKMYALFAAFFLLLPFLIFAGNRETYIELSENNRLDELKEHLKKWERENKKDPDLYLALSEYHLVIGGQTGFASDTYTLDENNGYAVINPKNGKIVGYLNRDFFYEVKVIDTAVGYLDKGLSYGPDRLDLFFAKISLLAQIGEFDKQADVAQELLERSVKNGNKWLWTENESVPDGLMVMMENLQDSYGLWLNIFSETAAAAVRKTAEKQIALYADTAYGYHNLGLYYAFNDDIAQALKTFLSGEKASGATSVLFGNIAYCYELLGNIDQAVAYYEKIAAAGTAEEVEFANGRIAELTQ